MKLSRSFKFALNILVHSRLRSWLTIIGIVIGVGSVVAIVSIGEGLQASVAARLSGLGADAITINPGFERAGASGGFGGGGLGHLGGGGGGGGQRTTSSVNSSLTDNDAQVMRGISDILYVTGQVSGSATVYYLGESANGRLRGVDPSNWQYFVSEDVTGRMIGPADTNVAVLGSKVGNAFKNSVGVNQLLTIGNSQSGGLSRIVRVVGILGPSQGDDNTIFMPIDLAQQILDKPTQKYDSIMVKASSVDAVESVVASIEQGLMLSHHVSNTTKDFTVTSAKALQQNIASVTSSITLFLGAIAAVSLLVGAVGVANTMFTSVLEKTREIGIMKAIGAKNRDVMIVFLINSALVGLAGGILGIILGIGLSAVMPMLIPSGGSVTLTPIVTSRVIFMALGISVIIGMLAGFIPARNASRMNPVDALRYE